MYECMGEGNCWNGMANIGERCYYPTGFGPTSGPGGSAGNIFSFFSQVVLMVLGLLFVH